MLETNSHCFGYRVRWRLKRNKWRNGNSWWRVSSLGKWQLHKAYCLPIINTRKTGNKDLATGWNNLRRFLFRRWWFSIPDQNICLRSENRATTTTSPWPDGWGIHRVRVRLPSLLWILHVINPKQSINIQFSIFIFLRVFMELNLT